MSTIASAQVIDTSAQGRPAATAPTITDSAVVDLNRIRISNDALSEVVEYGAKDSMLFDVKRKQVHLYGEASVKYTSLNIKAGYILLDYDKNEISAESFPDSTGKAAGLPDFKDADQHFTATKLRYNFETKKGIIYEARTKQEDIYVLGERAKFVGAADPSDTTQHNTIYNKNALLTTCSADEPHFGIRAQKLKVIPDRLVVTGPANLELAGIPTPLMLPFGFFPITKTRKAGLIIPRDFEFADKEGLGIRDFGWYQPISEHMDAKLLFNAYVSGSWGVAGNLNYNRLYHYTGDFYMSYNKRVTENQYAQKEAFKSFALRWAHRQSDKAHPSRTFSGSINIETNRDQNRNRNDYQSVIQNQLSSNMSYSKRFPGKPYQFSVSMNHSQNTQSRLMTINLPNVNFNMQRIYPFKRKVPEGKEHWYEKISLSYSSQLQNTFSSPDTSLFTRKTLETARMGIMHKAGTDFNFKLFKFINISPRVSFDENWYPYIIEKQLLNDSLLVYDTTRVNGEIVSIKVNENKSKYGIPVTNRNWGFNAFRTYNAGVSAGTVMFYTKTFQKGWFRGFRHKVTPSVSMNFAPDFTKPKYGYFKTVETDLRRGTRFNDTVRYSIFDEGIFGRPTYSKQNLYLSYSLGNLLEFKHFSARRDTVLRKKIFDNLTFSGSYNLSVDTLKWSPITTSGTFRLFKNLVNLNWGVGFDPYINDAKGARINKFAIREEGKLVRMPTFGIQLTTNLTVKQLRDIIEGGEDVRKTNENNTKKVQKDDLIGWLSDFNIGYDIGFKRRLIATGYGTVKDTVYMDFNSIRVSGKIPISSKWRIDINNIAYNFQEKSFPYPDLALVRDLHCWEMRLSWQLDRSTYTFSIYAKPGTLDFLKVPYRKNNFDAKAVF